MLSKTSSNMILEKQNMKWKPIQNWIDLFLVQLLSELNRFYSLPNMH